jgi:hypothetical protein
MGFGFQYDEGTSVLENVGNCELWDERLFARLEAKGTR